MDHNGNIGPDGPHSEHGLGGWCDVLECVDMNTHWIPNYRQAFCDSASRCYFETGTDTCRDSQGEPPVTCSSYNGYTSTLIKSIAAWKACDINPRCTWNRAWSATGPYAFWTDPNDEDEDHSYMYGSCTIADCHSVLSQDECSLYQDKCSWYDNACHSGPPPRTVDCASEGWSYYWCSQLWEHCYWDGYSCQHN